MVDVVVLVLLLAAFLVGCGRGLVRSLVGLVGNLAALALAFVAAAPAAQWSGERFGMVGVLAQKIQKLLPLPEGFDEAIASTEGVSALYTYLNQLPLPKGLRQSLVQNVQDHVHELGQGVFMTMSESVARVVAEYIWQGVVFVILWLAIAALIMGGSRLIMHVVHQVPIVGTVDRAAGGVIMMLLVAVTLAVLYNALGVFVGLHAEDHAILAAIGQSKILGGLQSMLQAAVTWKHAG